MSMVSPVPPSKSPERKPVRADGGSAKPHAEGPLKASYYKSGGSSEQIDLPASVFGHQINIPVMHQVVVASAAAQRAGTHSTKTRAEVRGGGAKPWRQKGTGRARHGSIREPQWVGGGVAHGPKPTDHSVRVNKKTRALALKSALADRAREGNIVVADIPALESPKTSEAVDLLETWQAADAKVLIVCAPSETESHMPTWKSFRNLPMVLTVAAASAFTVLAADKVIFSKAAFDRLATNAGEAKKGGGESAKPTATET
ncbi:MAG: 50S ribosomal protein L4, partial [Actinomycetota bacterium]